MTTEQQSTGEFHIVTGLQPDDIRLRIAQHCNLPVDSVRDEEVRLLHDAYYGRVPGMPVYIHNKYLREGGEVIDNRMHSISLGAELLFADEIVNATYGVSFPDYQRALQEMKDEGTQWSKT